MEMTFMVNNSPLAGKEGKFVISRQLRDRLYRELLKEDGTTERLKPLAEVFGETPEGAIDAYAIRLGDTELYKNSPALHILPADTVICLHEKIFGQNNYEKEVDAFKLIATIAENKEN